MYHLKTTICIPHQWFITRNETDTTEKHMSMLTFPRSLVFKEFGEFIFRNVLNLHGAFPQFQWSKLDNISRT
ncbi:hypothetical protein FGO68_gene1910 [Halteria grandinella]|uniref:Uncharacterized protein n=1 Tax=Halteria grandinella TaxID=5974 RepID=A0A8J8N943_HALGN|nr:hypothetical protein FGO68_gene1910 [Halteria grandinella]